MLQKTISGIETLAGLFLAFVAALTFVSVVLRYLFSFRFRTVSTSGA